MEKQAGAVKMTNETPTNPENPQNPTNPNTPPENGEKWNQLLDLVHKYRGRIAGLVASVVALLGSWGIDVSFTGNTRMGNEYWKVQNNRYIPIKPDEQEDGDIILDIQWTGVDREISDLQIYKLTRTRVGSSGDEPAITADSEGRPTIITKNGMAVEIPLKEMTQTPKPN